MFHLQANGRDLATWPVIGLSASTVAVGFAGRVTVSVLGKKASPVEIEQAKARQRSVGARRISAAALLCGIAICAVFSIALALFAFLRASYSLPVSIGGILMLLFFIASTALFIREWRKR